VLLVQDEPAVRTFARHVLQRYGYPVLEASDGEEACHIAADEKHRIAILVTDVVMPSMNGKELAARLRERMANLKVVSISGYAGESVDLQPHMTNAVFLQKPFTAAALACTVRQLLDYECSSPQANQIGDSKSARTRSYEAEAAF
jgi:two-component system, cell cycle sensor histidine kinase and response regulator CckA